MEMTTMAWLLFGSGFLPWRIGWRMVTTGNLRRKRRLLTIQAAFWRLQVVQRVQGRHWRLTLPLIARLKSAIWSALQQLIKA